MERFLIEQVQAGIMTLTMNRPDKRNALSEKEEMLEFVEVCDRLRADKNIKVLVLTGAGTSFSAGGNIKHMRDKKGFSAGTPMQIRDAYRSGIQKIPLALYELDVPTIAAVNGPAIGAGMDLSCMCDVRIASTAARFASSFVKLGIVPADGGAWLLARTIGPAKALEMMLTGDTIDALEAKAIGLVSKVVEADQLLETAHAMAHSIAKNPALTLRLSKRLLRESMHMSLASSLEMAAAYQALAHYTKDHDEAVRAFIDKREPQFINA